VSLASATEACGVLVLRGGRAGPPPEDEDAVAIVGAGPAGLTLALLLRRRGIESVVPRAPRPRLRLNSAYGRACSSTTRSRFLRDLGVAERLEREGMVHDGIYLRHQGSPSMFDRLARRTARDDIPASRRS